MMVLFIDLTTFGIYTLFMLIRLTAAGRDLWKKFLGQDC